MREDVIGRANVEDTPELDAYYAELGRQQSYALWTVANSIEPWHPQPTSLPTLWSYAAMRPLVLQALDLVSPEKAGRRVIALENPGRKGLSACVGWLYTGLQVMRPGEFATAHNHASAALRFIMEGAGAYTVVDGHKMDLGGRRLRHHAERHLARSRRRGRTARSRSGRTASTCCWSTSSTPTSTPCIPSTCRSRTFRSTTPSRSTAGRACCRRAARPGASPTRRCSSTNGADLRDAGASAAQASDGSPYDGIIMQYVNPATGGPVMKTLGACIQLLRARRAHQGASPHRLDRLQRRQGQRPFDHRRPALRLEEERHLRRAVVGLARARQRFGARGRGAVLVQRPAVDAGARALSRRGATPRTADISRRCALTSPESVRAEESHAMTIRLHRGDLPDLSR